MAEATVYVRSNSLCPRLLYVRGSYAEFALPGSELKTFDFKSGNSTDLGADEEFS